MGTASERRMGGDVQGDFTLLARTVLGSALDRMDIEIRDMTLADWPDVARIYGEGIATGLATFENAVPPYDEWNVTHHPRPRLVALAAGTVVGWAALSPVSRREVYRGVAEVSVYVQEASRGEGVGHALLAALVDRAVAMEFWTLQASIFAENAASIALHDRAGFRSVGRRERIAQLRGEWKDTILMERRL